MIGRIATTILNCNKHTLDLSLLSLIDVLLVVSNNSLWESLSDCVDLSNITSTSHSDTDVQVLETLKTEQEDGFEYLYSEGLRLEELNRWAVDSEDAFARTHWSDGNWVFLSAEALGQLQFGFGHGEIIMEIILLLNNTLIMS